MNRHAETFRNEDRSLPVDENGFSVYCTPDQLCDDCQRSELRDRIDARRRRRAVEARARQWTPPKTPWQPPPKPSALRWRRGRGPGSYA